MVKPPKIPLPDPPTPVEEEEPKDTSPCSCGEKDIAEIAEATAEILDSKNL
jgi:hypothetical protein